MLHPLLKVDLKLKQGVIIALVKKSVCRPSKKNEDGEYQLGIIRKRASTLGYNIYKQYRHNYRICLRDSVD